MNSLSIIGTFEIFTRAGKIMSFELYPSVISLTVDSGVKNPHILNQEKEYRWSQTAMVTSAVCSTFFFGLTIASGIALQSEEDPSSINASIWTVSGLIGTFGFGLGLVAFVTFCITSAKRSSQQMIELEPV